MAFIESGSDGSVDGTSIRPASAIAAASPRAGNDARAPALASGAIGGSAADATPLTIVDGTTAAAINATATNAGADLHPDPARVRWAGMRGSGGGCRCGTRKVRSGAKTGLKNGKIAGL
ncbi:MAG: hypothetical protein ACKO4T_11485 [Planctomycetaceae bacterium]